MSSGLLIAKESHNVNSKPEDLYVNRDSALFKLFRSGTGKQTFSTGGFPETYDITVPHTLGYTPFVLVFMDRNPGTNRRMVTASENSAPTSNDIFCLLTRVTNRDFTINTQGFGATPGDYYYQYFIYYDTLQVTS